MGADQVAEVISLLDRRGDVLEYLSRRPRTQAEIAEDLEISRSTVTRAIQELGSADLVERADGRYRATGLGTGLLEIYTDYKANVRALIDHSEICAYLPPDAPFDPDILSEGTYYSVESGAPFQIGERVNEQFRQAEAIMGLGRTRSERASSSVYRQKVLEEERPVENVFSRSLFEHIRDLSWSTKFFSAPNADFYVHDSVPYGLFVLDTPEERRVLLILYDEDEAMKGVICSTETTAVAWAEGVYRDFREAATHAEEYLE